LCEETYIEIGYFEQVAVALGVVQLSPRGVANRQNTTASGFHPHTLAAVSLDEQLQQTEEYSLSSLRPPLL
jgi:hypothetical protein